jgi:hypothetical protein
MTNITSATETKQEEAGNQVKYAPWQRIESKYGSHYVVFKIGGLDEECYYVVELDEDFLISKVIVPDEYDLDDPKSLCFGCDMCDGHDEAISNTIQNREPETCVHREAVITVLKRKHDFDNNNIGGVAGEEYKERYNADGWVINFTPSKY